VVGLYLQRYMPSMTEPFGRRATLEWRIRYANYASYGFGGAIVVAVLMALEGGATRDLWLIGGVFSAAAAVTAVRLVTASRVELFQLGAPGPSLLRPSDRAEED
jgi:hypothetical protein